MTGLGRTERRPSTPTRAVELGALGGSSLELTARCFRPGERTPVDLAWGVRLASSANTALPVRAGHQDPAEQVQVKDQGDDEYQAPPVSRGAEHNDDGGDPNCQQQPNHQR